MKSFELWVHVLGSVKLIEVVLVACVALDALVVGVNGGVKVGEGLLQVCCGFSACRAENHMFIWMVGAGVVGGRVKQGELGFSTLGAGALVT